MTDYLSIFQNLPEKKKIFSSAYYELSLYPCDNIPLSKEEILPENQCGSQLEWEPYDILLQIIQILSVLIRSTSHPSDIRFAATVYQEYFWEHAKDYEFKYEEAIKFGKTAELLKIACQIEDTHERPYYGMYDFDRIKKAIKEMN